MNFTRIGSEKVAYIKYEDGDIIVLKQDHTTIKIPNQPYSFFKELTELPVQFIDQRLWCWDTLYSQSFEKLPHWDDRWLTY